LAAVQAALRPLKAGAAKGGSEESRADLVAAALALLEQLGVKEKLSPKVLLLLSKAK
jgi:hypothetical protein